MKKLACILLSAAIMTSTATCAFDPAPREPAESPAVSQSAEAAGGKTTDQRLAEVASKVKAALGIGGGYEEFYGDFWENELAPRWSLNWNRESDSISVEALESGKITSYYFSETDDGSYNGRGALPAFPAVSRAQARQAAQAFLDKVLDDGETVQFKENSAGRWSMDTHYFSGTILINGLESPLSFSVSVRAEDGKVVRFYRDCLEGSYIGGIPSPAPAAGAQEAGELLRDTLSLRTEYVLEGDQAVLRYLPEAGDDYFVDARTGELVNLTELYENVDHGEAGASKGTARDAAVPEAAADSGGGLTQVEREGAAKLEGVLSREDLDKKLREISPLGLDNYTLASANYSLNKETGEVTAQLYYTRRDGDDTWRRTVSCDAKTGALQAVWSSAPYNENRTASVGEAQARETAESFLERFWGGEYAKMELYSSDPWEPEDWDAAHSFTYAQKENGFFCPENSLNVSVDIEDGSVSGFSRTWTDVKEFESPDGILSEAEALDAWFHHYQLRLGYDSIPVKLDPNMADAVPLLDRGYSYFYSLKLTYTLTEQDGSYASGLNAKTGEIITESWYGQDGSIAYSDLDGYAGREKLEALAGYGIGWSGEKCEPDKALTQLDYIALLVSTDGYRYDPEEGDPDALYRMAYTMGILRAGEREDSRVLTRGDVVRMLLTCAGYGDIARLSGIFTCSYPDAGQIPENLLGCAAIAQGMGIVDAGQAFAAGRDATRGEAAEMLYNFMAR